MSYLERNARKRIEPAQVLAAARSIITLGRQLCHAPAAADCPPCLFASHWGNCAAMPAFRDYHQVVGARLKSLTQWVNRLGGEATRSLWYVDTGPLLERDLAQRAGLGFIGKHTNLISRKLGNWFFLAEIITTLELPPDAAGEKSLRLLRPCCLAACPTSAIPAPFQLDARRCLSYLTIELKGAIPWSCARPWATGFTGATIVWRLVRGTVSRGGFHDGAALPRRAWGRRICWSCCRWTRRALERDLPGRPSCGPSGADFCAMFAWPWGIAAMERPCRRCNGPPSDPDPLIAEHALWAIGQINAK